MFYFGARVKQIFGLHQVTVRSLNIDQYLHSSKSLHNSASPALRRRHLRVVWCECVRGQVRGVPCLSNTLTPHTHCHTIMGRHVTLSFSSLSSPLLKGKFELDSKALIYLVTLRFPLDFKYPMYLLFSATLILVYYNDEKQQLKIFLWYRFFKLMIVCPLTSAEPSSRLTAPPECVAVAAAGVRVRTLAIVITAHCGQLWHNHYWHRFNIIYCCHTCHLAHHQPQQCCFVVTLETLERYVRIVHAIYIPYSINQCNIVLYLLLPNSTKHSGDSCMITG